jgi:hypothetical protein
VSDEKDKPTPPARQPVAHEISAKFEGRGNQSVHAGLAQAASPKFEGKGELSVGTSDGYWRHVKVWRRYDKPVGRPSSRDPIRVEAQRRLDTGEVPATLKEFGNKLSVWLENHPDAPQMSGERVEKCVRDLWHVAGR